MVVSVISSRMWKWWQIHCHWGRLEQMFHFLNAKKKIKNSFDLELSLVAHFNGCSPWGKSWPNHFYLLHNFNEIKAVLEEIPWKAKGEQRDLMNLCTKLSEVPLKTSLCQSHCCPSPFHDFRSDLLILSLAHSSSIH